MDYRVIAVRRPGEAERTVYRTADRENCSTWAESYFMREHAHHVRAVGYHGHALTDQKSRPYVWDRKEEGKAA